MGRIHRGTFEDNRGYIPELQAELEGPEILEDEIKNAIEKIKHGKSARNDGVMTEMVSACGDFSVQTITKMANKIYKTGNIPYEMRKSI